MKKLCETGRWVKNPGREPCCSRCRSYWKTHSELLSVVAKAEAGQNINVLLTSLRKKKLEVSTDIYGYNY